MVLARITRLRWRLTLSFVASALLSTLLAQFLIISATSFLELQEFFNPTALLAEIESRVNSREFRVLLEKGSRREMEAWTTSQVEPPFDLGPGPHTLITVNHVTTTAILTSPTGEVLASFPAGNIPNAAAIPDDLKPNVSASSSFWDKEPGRQAYRFQAVIRDSAGRLVAFAIIRRELVGGLPTVLWNLLFSLAPTAVFLAFFSSIVGSLFGLYSSRPITNHIAELRAAATAWSNGHFSRRAPVHGKGELDLLSTSLNTMAQSLQHLFRLRREKIMLEERQRLARDLHDSVRQHLFAASMQIGAIRAATPDAPQPPIARSLDSLEALVREIQREIAAMSEQFHPEPGSNVNLVESCWEVVTFWQNNNNIPIEVWMPDQLFVSPTENTTCRRILQEALSNISRHSRASKASLRLQVNLNRVTLEIEDNGQSFHEPKPGMGLSNLRERALSLPGGICEVDARPSRGTRIAISFSPTASGVAA